MATYLRSFIIISKRSFKLWNNVTLFNSHLSCNCMSTSITEPGICSHGESNGSEDDLPTRNISQSERKSRKNGKLHSRVKSDSDVTDWSQISKTFSAEDTFGNWVDTGQQDKKRNRLMKSDVRRGGAESSRWAVDKDWAESFGTLNPDHSDLKEIDILSQSFEGDDEDSEEPHRRLAVEGRKHTQNWYGKQIEKLSKEGKIYECIEMLETKMLKEDRVLPNQYVFTVLIGALGRVGYTKKAFSLFNKMKKYGLQPEDPTYTALFNACSVSPWREDGLKRAHYLRQHMVEKGHQPNLITYRAMVKAFGLCGDLQVAFSLVDELVAAGFRADERVLSVLLQACVSDKEAGLRHGIQVWRHLSKKKKLRVNLFHYNLLLRTVRDCSIGDPKLANQLLESGSHDPKSTTNHLPQSSIADNRTHSSMHSPDILEIGGTATLTTGHIQSTDPNNLSSRHDETMQHVDSSSENTLVENQAGIASNIESSSDVMSKEIDVRRKWWSYQPESTQLAVANIQEPASVSILNSRVPDILSPSGDLSNIVGLGDMKSPENRLALFGGLPGIMKRMARDRVEPDIKTFTLLLEVIPSTREAERDLLAAMVAHRVSPDIDLLNLMIRKRNLRRDYSGARGLLSVLGSSDLQPNLMTYGCLAMGCPRKEDGLQLLNDMEKANLVPSVNIYTILLTQAYYDFSYKMAVCLDMHRQAVRPNTHLLTRLETSINKARALVVRKEKGLDVPHYAQREDFIENFNQFMRYYRKWLHTIGLDREPHAWEQFRRPTPSE